LTCLVWVGIGQWVDLSHNIPVVEAMLALIVEPLILQLAAALDAITIVQTRWGHQV
jgi:hypothetical protein